MLINKINKEAIKLLIITYIDNIGQLFLLLFLPFIFVYIYMYTFDCNIYVHSFHII